MSFEARTALFAALCISALACVSTAEGETVALAEAARESAPEMAEIVVTAQKRAQKLSDVGITIVTETGEQLVSAGVTDVSQLTRVAPGFSVGTSFAGYPIFSLRGVNFNAAQISAAPAVSTYMDQAILPYPAMTGGLLLDVDRVEVLKGPQGTLFGQNATGGSINVIAAKPTNVFSAGVSTEVNNFGQTMLQGFVSGPLSDTLRARLAASTTQFGAWQKGYYLNHNKNGAQDKGAIRLLLDWTPINELRVSTNFNANYDHGEIQQSQLSRVTPNNPATAYPGLIGYHLPTSNRDVEIDPGFDTRAHTRMYQGVVRADYELTDDLTLTSLSNYAYFSSHSLRNLDAVALPILNVAPTGNIHSFSQELRIAGKAADSKINYIIGGNYERDSLQDNLAEIFPGYSTLPPGSIIDDRFVNTIRAAGAFANIDYEFIPRLSLTAGARYTSVKETTAGCSYGNAQAAGLFGFIANIFRAQAGLPPSTAYVPGGCLTINDNVPVAPGGAPDYQPIATNAEQHEHNISWRAGLNFKPTSDTLVYTLVSRGFKAGVYPSQTNILNSTEFPVKQEQLTSYEIGTKLAFFDRLFLLNAAAFYYDYRDKQFFTYLPLPIVGSGSVVLNVPKSSVRGGEVEITATPLNDVTLHAAVTYIKTKLGQFKAYNFQQKLTDISGTEFNFAPPWSATFDAEYRLPMLGNGIVTPYVGLSGLFNSRTYGDLGELAAARVPQYFILDARVGLVSSKGWRAGLFVHNLTDKYYWTSVVPTGDTDSKSSGLPRTFGINAEYRF
jgi:outer membrane receptor protein involved in Fe transport